MAGTNSRVRVFRRNPVYGPVLAMVAGLGAECALPGEPASYWPAMLMIPLGLLAMFGRVGEAVRALVVVTGCFLAGGWWLSLHPLAEVPEVNVAPGERATVQGCVVSAARRLPEQVRFVVEVEEGRRVQASIYARPGEVLPHVQYGERVVLVARVRPPRNFGNPGSFDYERYLRRQGIFWLASASGAGALRKEEGECGSPLLAWLQRTRTGLLERVASRYAEDTFARGYLPAILFGEDQLLGEEAKERFRRAGVYHTLVISGQHIAIVGGACLLLLQLAPIPRWMRFLLVAATCWSYALLSGAETPAVRAASGVTLYLAGSLAYRRARPVNLLAVVALVFLAWDPGLILDTGFQLSFVAVLLIVGIAAPLQRHWFGQWPKVARRLGNAAGDLRLPAEVAAARVELRLVGQTLGMATRIPCAAWLRMISLGTLLAASVGSLLVVSVVVQVGLSPLLVAYFHRAPVAGPLANLVVSPLLGLVVPLAFVDLAVAPPLLAQGLTVLSGWVEGVTGWLAAMGPDWRVPEAPGWLMALCTLWIFGGIAACEPFLARAPRMRRPDGLDQRKTETAGVRQVRRAGRWRFGAAACGVAVGGMLWGLLLAHPFAPRFAAGLLELTMIDVGQGESLLLVTPAGRTVLVDTGGLGGFSSASALDTGEDIVGPYLWSRGIRRLDLLVLTHFDFDHAGGAPAILRAFRPREMWVPGMPAGHLLGEQVMAEAKRQSIRVREVLAGNRDVLDGVEFSVLHPLVWQPTSERRNHQSLVMRLRYGGCRALLTGDLDRAGELRLLAGGENLAAELLKVAHHGSRTSSTEVFIEAVRPSFGLVSAGWLNAFGHPHPAVTGRLEGRGVAVWRTDRDGAVSLRTDGLRWQRGWP